MTHVSRFPGKTQIPMHVLTALLADVIPDVCNTPVMAADTVASDLRHGELNIAWVYVRERSSPDAPQRMVQPSCS